MALIRGGTPAPVRQVGEVVEIPDDIPRHGGDGRPKIWPADCTPGDPDVKHAYYTRASKLGECLEDAWSIQRAHERRVVFGIGRSTGLQDRAQAVTALDTDRAELDAIVEAAALLGGDGDAAMSGTAFHALTEREDRGDDLTYLSPRLLAALAAWRHLIGHFTIHGVEAFVVNDALQTAGTYDRLVSPLGIMTAPDGTVITPNDRIGLDLKSGKSADHFGPVYKVQQWVYFGDDARPYSHAAGRGEWPDLIPPRSDWSLIPHVPLDHPEDAGFYWVDLSEGKRLAELALTVREARRAKGLPAAGLPELGVLEVLPPAPAAGMTVEGLLGLIDQADGEGALGALYEAHGTVWNDECNAAARARMAAGPSEPPPAVPVQGETIGRLRAATTPDELGVIYAAHVGGGGTWTPYLSTLADQRLAELSGTAAVAS